MISLETRLSQTQREAQELENSSSKKRKWQVEEVYDQKSVIIAKSTKSMFGTELHQETKLPLDYWQRCLDTKSQIQFHNTRTQDRTSKNPRISPEPASPGHVSLDLELNLACSGSTRTKINHKHHNFTTTQNSGSFATISGDRFPNCAKNKEIRGRTTAVPSWLAFEGDEREMVTAVCKNCHMLVMMYKSSTACPNCKFMHSTDQSPSKLFEPWLSLL